ASISGRCRLTLYLGNWSFDVSASDRVTYGSTGTATATVTPGAGTVSFSAAGSTGCSVSGTTVSVITAGGSCTLTASVAENNNYLAATSAPFSVTLNKALALVIPTNLIQTYTGNPLQPTVGTAPVGLSLIYTGSDSLPQTNVNTYNVGWAINDVNYQGYYGGTFQ